MSVPDSAANVIGVRNSGLMRLIPDAHMNLRMLRVLAIPIWILLSACSRSEGAVANSEDAAMKAIPVRLSPVQLRPDDELLRFAGVSRVRQRAELTFQVNGVVQSRDVDIGHEIKPGQILMTLYNPTLQPNYDAARHRLAQLQADQSQATSELDRLLTLHERGVIPLQELEQQATRADSLQSAVSNADASLQQAASLLREAELLAPFAGTVEQILLEPGEFAQAGQAVIRIASATQLEVEIRVPAHLTDSLTVGQQLAVWPSLANTTSKDSAHMARVIEIGRSNTGESALYPVVLALPENSVRTGEALEVGVARRLEPALVIPMAAVMRSADGLTVFHSVNNRVKRVAVEIEQLQGEYAIIKPGALPEGALVVYSGITRLADGDLVEVLP